ncbi:hypothetical protein OG874_37475 [Nocardia sp. NBC_00565]|uniref:hypothetical protein n=1 Tax=Nocardia sp. NBC_00565 TaxID=2975993 RepID=UPI002E808C0E|nr:hypothetical protein [Nocardia sp. NBC_00565]WUC02358.1 hypothetical protein OG874_37475 [Nocardia sp. NBC_00565]
MLTARTLAEAQTYLSLMAASDDAPEAVQSSPPVSSLTEGEQAWTVHSGLGDVEVPYASEDACRRLGVWFGLGVSQLVDAGQWIMVASTYARRALEADLAYQGKPGQDRNTVELNWQFAGEAIGEAIKFLPEGAYRLPDTAFWSAQGEQMRRDQPERITRAQLVDDKDYYVGTLEDFRALYDE